MNDVKQRIAKAIAALFECDDAESWDVYGHQFEQAVEAALKAMREPTGPMASAGHAQLADGGASDAWRAMIDEALRDG